VVEEGVDLIGHGVGEENHEGKDGVGGNPWKSTKMEMLMIDDLSLEERRLVKNEQMSNFPSLRYCGWWYLSYYCY